MKNILFYLLCLFLTGCANQAVDNYVPFTPAEEMKSPGQYAIDLNNCRWMAHEYLKQNQGLDVASILNQSGQSAASSFSYIQLSPLAIPFGGAGGATKEMLSELGLDTSDAKQFVHDCLHDKGLESGLYHIYGSK